MLRPRTVAVFGGESAAKVIEQCRRIGYGGELWAVNPGREQLAGLPCYASIDELPGVPDASFIAAPPGASLDIVRTLAARGASGAVCFAAGFAETGEAGEQLQQQLQDAAGDMPVIGPNCHGFVNYLDKVALWPDEHGGQHAASGVALIAQSGNIAINLTMQQRGIDYSYVLSVGNNSALGMHDYINALLDDPRVTAIGLHIEGLDDIHAFSKAAIRALQKRIPIVAFKAGRSKRGAEITMSHTGSLAGSDALYSALFKRLGIARCDTVSQFLETMKFVSTVGVLTEPTIASMSCSGGDASIVADNAEALGLETPALSDTTSRNLKALLGPNVDVANPLDYHLYIWGDIKKLTECFTEVLNNQFACSLLVLDYPPGSDNDDTNWQISERALLAAVEATGQRAVIVSSLVETLSEDARQRLKGAEITAMQGIEDCLFAIRAAVSIGRAQANVDEIDAVLPAVPTPSDSSVLDEVASKRRVAAAGITIPRAITGDRATVENAADSIGYPLVLKAVDADLAHKSEAGAVAVGIADPVALSDALSRMAKLSERFLVEEMIGPSVAELIIGVSRDASFGLSLLIGSGGTLVELVDDTVSLLLPARRSDIEDALSSLKVKALLDGFRGGQMGNVKAAVDAIDAIARFAVENNQSLIELDVNPLLVTPTSAVAVDALIRESEHQ